MAQVENAKDSKQVIVNLTMTVAEARQVIWEDAYNPRGPIGDLLDSKKIGYNNLAWGVEGAWKPEMKSAARTLLAYWLGEPATLEATRRYGPEVIEGSHYLEDEETDGMMQFMIYMTGGLFFGFIAIWNIVQQIFSNKTGPIPLPIVIASNLLIAAVAGLWIIRKTKQQFARWKNSRRGRLGENTVVETIRTAVDNHWTIFRNLHLPDRKDDVDIALVGPGGVWALEVKAFREIVRVANGTWERQTKRGWKRLDKNPSKQATDNAVRLNRFLQQQGINRWVEKRVILSEPQAISNVEQADDVWILPQIEDKVAHLSTRTLPTEDEIKRIVGLFRELATKQIVTEEAKYKK
jgi:hypothetical protein